MSTLMKNTILMSVINIIMRTISVVFNAYLTSKAGAAGMGLFQLVMTVYTLAVTFACGGMKLAATRVTVEIRANNDSDERKSTAKSVVYALICGSFTAVLMFCFSDVIASSWLSSAQTTLPIKILSLSLPFVAMSAACGGYFTAIDQITKYSCILLVEQIAKIAVTTVLLFVWSDKETTYTCMAMVIGITAAEMISFMLSFILKFLVSPEKTNKKTVSSQRILRIAVPDALGTSARSVLLTIEHLLIPKRLEKSGEDPVTALAAYGSIHGMALPVLMYPYAILNSFSLLLVPHLAKINETDNAEIKNATVKRNLKRTFLFSIICTFAAIFFAPALSELLYHSDEAVMYIRILSPLLPVMYTDTITDAMLKGLDCQIFSMKYNIFDSALCVVAVWFLLPIFSVKGYIFILYASEIINFGFSICKLLDVCEIRVFQVPSKYNSKHVQRRIYSASHKAYGCQKYQVREKHSQVR